MFKLLTLVDDNLNVASLEINSKQEMVFVGGIPTEESLLYFSRLSEFLGCMSFGIKSILRGTKVRQPTTAINFSVFCSYFLKESWQCLMDCHFLCLFYNMLARIST